MTLFGGDPAIKDNWEEVQSSDFIIKTTLFQME